MKKREFQRVWRRQCLFQACGILIAALSLLVFQNASASVSVMTFDSTPVGTIYGAPTHSQGDVVLTEDGIDMSVEDYYLAGVPYFQEAEIMLPPPPPEPAFGSGHALYMRWIGCKFDFTATPESPGPVLFEFYDQGASFIDNLQVNGETLHEFDHFSTLDGVEVASGVTCHVTYWVFGMSEWGTVALDGPVETMQVAGQELFVDAVRIDNEYEGPGDPGDIECILEVSHDDEAMGAAWGSAYGDAIGDVIIVENDIPVELRRWEGSLGAIVFNECHIDPDYPNFGDIQTLHCDDIGVCYEIHNLGIDVAAVTFQFRSCGGEDNLRVNGAPMYIGDIESAPSDIAPGITFTVLWQTVSPGCVSGAALLEGDVRRLRVGGENFWVDEVCVYEDETGTGCDLLVDFETRTAGEEWGAIYADMPGDYIFTEDGIDVGLEVFTRMDLTTVFDRALIESAAGTCLELNTMDLRNISTTYDIAAAGVDVAMVYFDFRNNGGYQNLQVNGASLYTGMLETAPFAIAPGITCTVVAWPDGFDTCGRVYLIGEVQHLLVGGQEFQMDNVCVITVEDGIHGGYCDHLVRFETEPLGSNWGGSYSEVPGDVIFVEDDIPVSVHEFFNGSDWDFWNCGIVEAAPSTGVTDGQALFMGAISTEYDFTGLGMPTAEVRFEFVDWDGIENIQINGGPYIYYGQITDFPAEISGVSYYVDWWTIPGGEAAGTVILDGNVETLRLGGQQFLLDNICVILANGTSVDVPLSASDRLLNNPYPNPLNPKTTLSFTLDEASPVRLSIYSVAGREMTVLVDEPREAGTHSVVWEGRDRAGQPLPSGVYFARIEAAGKVDTRKLTLLK